MKNIWEINPLPYLTSPSVASNFAPKPLGNGNTCIPYGEMLKTLLDEFKGIGGV